MKFHPQYIDIREEMELIKEKQQKIALKAEKLILLTNVKGIVDNNGSLLSKISEKRARIILKKNIAKGGMQPKLEAAIFSVSNGVKSSHIIDGRLPHAVLLEVLTREGVGTLIY